MGKYIYEGHLGGLYCSDEKIDYSNLYCDECGENWGMLIISMRLGLY